MVAQCEAHTSAVADAMRAKHGDRTIEKREGSNPSERDPRRLEPKWLGGRRVNQEKKHRGSKQKPKRLHAAEPACRKRADQLSLEQKLCKSRINAARDSSSHPQTSRHGYRHGSTRQMPKRVDLEKLRNAKGSCCNKCQYCVNKQVEFARLAYSKPKERRATRTIPGLTVTKWQFVMKICSQIAKITTTKM